MLPLIPLFVTWFFSAFYSLFCLSSIVSNKYLIVISCMLLSCISYAFFNILIDNKLIKLMQKLLGCLLVLRLSIYILFPDARAEMLPWHFFFLRTLPVRFCLSVWLRSESRGEQPFPLNITRSNFNMIITYQHQRDKVHTSGQSSCRMWPQPLVSHLQMHLAQHLIHRFL